MIRMFLFGALLLASGLNASTEGLYLGGQYHRGTYDEVGYSAVNPSGLGFVFGKYLLDDLSIEGRLITGMADDSINISGTDVSVEIDSVFSIFLKGDIPVLNVNLYGLLGHTTGKITGKTTTSTFSADDSGLSYGFGVEGKLNDALWLNAEYVMYINESIYDYSGINFGIKHLF